MGGGRLGAGNPTSLKRRRTTRMAGKRAKKKSKIEKKKSTVCRESKLLSVLEKGSKT